MRRQFLQFLGATVYVCALCHGYCCLPTTTAAAVTNQTFCLEESATEPRSHRVTEKNNWIIKNDGNACSSNKQNKKL